MSNLPYTDDDLRAEAANQHASLTEDPEFMCIGEAMGDSIIASTGDGPNLTWGDLLPNEDAFSTAQKKIRDLIVGAADVSEWAVNLGADGLEPDGHTLQLGVDPGNGDQPRIRVHFAFHPDMPAPARDQFVMELSRVVLRNL
ncbi:hypothetical protein ACIOHC_21320 [Streptomyces sp. NPDC088252]|uniref:hypothetical protein n=1 Tax=unclassified Streptomyces TaxID=2593676 RepID=UPI0037F320B1